MDNESIYSITIALIASLIQQEIELLMDISKANGSIYEIIVIFLLIFALLRLARLKK